MSEAHISQNWNPLLALTWEHALVGMAFVANDGKWLRANPYFCRLLGRTESELKSMKWQDVTLSVDNAIDERAVQEVLAGAREEYEMLKYYQPRIGEPIPVKLKVVGVHTDEGGTVAYFLSQALRIEASAQKVEVQLGSSEDEWLAVIRILSRHWKFVTFAIIVFFAIVLSESAVLRVLNVFEFVKGSP